MEFTVSHIEKLAELLRPSEPDVLQGEDLPASKYEITAARDKSDVPSAPQKQPKTIEEYEEQECKEAAQMGNIGFGVGDRKTPAYTMNYQQSVSAEDIFLQMGPKTPSSASCENLIVRVCMPGDKKENIDLAVDTASLTINSSRHYLKLSLPHDISPDTSKANWDASNETLVLTLKLQREFDFVNF